MKVLVDPETGEKTTSTLPIVDIVIGDRFRGDFGDVAALAASIRQVGLLHPIVVTTKHELIAGQRRLKACESLGVTEVPVRVITKVDEAVKFLAAERDENTCRKDFTPSEAVALGRALESLERPKAAQRQRGGPGAKLAPGEKGKTRDAVAGAVGLGHTTYEKAKEVVAAVADESLPDEVRDIAAEALVEMDDTGKVDGAYQKVRDALAATEAAVELAAGDPKVAAQLLKTKVHKSVLAVTKALKDLDPIEAANVIGDDDRDRLLNWAERHGDWMTSFRSGLRPLRAVKGNR